MPKLTPSERWKRHVMERFAAFRCSGELEKLRAQGLGILKREKLFTPEEWHYTFHERASLVKYREWHERCERVGRRFGLDRGTVVLACLIEDYRPDQQPFPIESTLPRVWLVTDSPDTQFVLRLAWEAQRRGLYVVQRHGDIENAHFLTMTDEPPPLPTSMPSRLNAFRIRAETPIGYPPEAAGELLGYAHRLSVEILLSLGYRVPKRLRTSPIVHLAHDMKVGQHVNYGGLYPIIDEVYGDEVPTPLGVEKESDMSQDQPRRREIKSRRRRLNKRLVTPYRRDDERTSDDSGPQSPSK